MSRKFSGRQALRVLVLNVFAVLFSAFIVYSASSVRHRIDGAPQTEYTVTELSLTHSVVRDASGQLVSPEQLAVAAASSGDASKQEMGAKKKPAPSKSTGKKTTTSKKSSPKKQVPKKQTPKKEAPKKPAAKPCPT